MVRFSWTILVRPHLEYVILASGLYLMMAVDRLEPLQRPATRTVKGCRGLSCEEQRIKLYLFSLARRRLRDNLILAYNLSISSLELPLEEFFTVPVQLD